MLLLAGAWAGMGQGKEPRSYHWGTPPQKKKNIRLPKEEIQAFMTSSIIYGEVPVRSLILPAMRGQHWLPAFRP